jgi:endonuclease YncB( thermonuclease family)
MIRKSFFWILLLALIAFWAFGGRLIPGETIRAEKVVVTDGDTLVLGGVTIRLYGMDAPEYRQTCKDQLGFDWPCGKVARQQLATLVASGEVICEARAEDQFRRKVASCAAGEVSDLARAMVSAGLALSPADRGSGVYETEQESARAAKRGIWQGQFTTPADWRESNPREDR